MKREQSAKAAPWYREPWPWLLMLGPLIVIIAGVITAYLAVVTSDGLVEDDYYKQGLTVNRRTERDQRAAELGVAAEFVLGEEGRRNPDPAASARRSGLAGCAQPAHCASDAPGFRSGRGPACRGRRCLCGHARPLGWWSLARQPRGQQATVALGGRLGDGNTIGAAVDSVIQGDGSG